MQRRLLLDVEHYLSLDELTLPYDEISIICATHYLTIRKLLETGDIRELKLTKFGEFTLKLKTRESLRHFPEFNVRCSTGEQDIISVW